MRRAYRANQGFSNLVSSTITGGRPVKALSGQLGFVSQKGWPVLLLLDGFDFRSPLLYDVTRFFTTHVMSFVIATPLELTSLLRRITSSLKGFCLQGNRVSLLSPRQFQKTVPYERAVLMGESIRLWMTVVSHYIMARSRNPTSK